MNKLKMDEIRDDFKIYKDIFISSATVMILIMQTYLILITNGIDLVGLEYINNNVLRIILQVIIQIFGFSFINIGVFYVCYKYYEIKWIKKNKEIWFQGEWLHIHDKKNVRIGVLKIKQRFSHIEVKDAKNISPNLHGINKKAATAWNYISATINPKEMLGIELLCSYIAGNAQEYKQGLHAFNEVQLGKDEFPCKMIGVFSDTLEGTENDIKDISDNNGRIYLLKITPEIKRFLYEKGGIDMNALANILYNPNLKSEDFCILLNKIIHKYGYTFESKDTHVFQ